MKKSTMIKSAAFGTMFAVSTIAAALNLSSGWNLVGNNSTTPINVATTFGDSAKISTVWQWNKNTSKWGFYTPSMTSAELSTYIAQRGYELITTINPKDGYWVNTVYANVTPTPAGTTAPTASDLTYGWNLVVGDSSTSPAQLARKLNTDLAASSKQVSTMWAFDNVTRKWKFYAPAMTAGALSDYIASKGYLPLTAIASEEGVWINVENGAAPVTVEITPDSLVLDCKPVVGTYDIPEINSTVNNAWHFQNNAWGFSNSPALTAGDWSECIGAALVSPTTAVARWTYDFGAYAMGTGNVTSDGTGTNIAQVKGYPYISYGNFMHNVKHTTGSDMPKQLKSFTSAIVSWDYQLTHSVSKVVNASSPGDGGNVAFDIWIGATPTTDYAHMKVEMMIWVDYWGNNMAAYDNLPNRKANVVIDGHEYKVYIDTTDSRYFVVYAALNPGTHTNDSINVTSFVSDLIARGYVTNSDYLLDIEFGNELYEGKGEMRINNFTVNVQ